MINSTLSFEVELLTMAIVSYMEQKSLSFEQALDSIISDAKVTERKEEK